MSDRDLDRYHLADLLLCYGEFGTTEAASKEGAQKCADAILAARRPRFKPCDGCDGHECDNGCAYPGAAATRK